MALAGSPRLPSAKSWVDTRVGSPVGAVPGSPVRYTIVATNNGPSDARRATVTDSLPAVLTGALWTCTASTGASCAAAGSRSISDTVDLPVGATAAYTLF